MKKTIATILLCAGLYGCNPSVTAPSPGAETYCAGYVTNITETEVTINGDYVTTFHIKRPEDRARLRTALAYQAKVGIVYDHDMNITILDGK